MPFIRCVFSAILFLNLTACLAVTGPARDPFDEEHEELSLDLGEKFNSFRANPAETDSDIAGVEAVADPESTTNPVTAPTGVVPSEPSPDINQQEFADFLKWKSERNSGSDDYQEFLEYQEYQKWLEFQKTKNPSE